MGSLRDHPGRGHGTCRGPETGMQHVRETRWPAGLNGGSEGDATREAAGPGRSPVNLPLCPERDGEPLQDL